MNKLNKRKLSALMKASYNDHLLCVRELINAGADGNTLNKKGFTALMIAVKRNHTKCVEQLLKLKSLDVDKGDFWNKSTALICAAHKGYESCAELLLHVGANMNLPNVENFTPLIYANINGHHECVELLLN